VATSSPQTNADGRYSGAAKGPGNDAAFAVGSDGKLSAAVAANRAARDGQTWIVVQ
jgi:hypothetical protein